MIEEDEISEELEDLLNEEEAIFIKKPKKAVSKKVFEKAVENTSKIKPQIIIPQITPVLILGAIIVILIIIAGAGMILTPPSNPPIDFNDLPIGVGNLPIGTEEGECTKNNDCDDYDVSTNDWCIETPKKCVNILIKTCVSGDDYCPDKCKNSNDKDCKKEKTCGEQNGFECLNSEYCSEETFETSDTLDCCPVNAECLSNNACDKVTCQNYERCENGACILKSCQEINGVICDENNTCFDSLVSTSDSFNCCLGQCVPIIGCGDDSDCDDDDESTLDSCTGEEQRFCSNTEITWCADGDGYCPEDCVYENDVDCYEPPAPPGPCDDIICENNETCVEGDCILLACSELGKICEEGNVCDGTFVEAEDTQACCPSNIDCVPEYTKWFSTGRNIFDGCNDLLEYEDEIIDISHFERDGLPVAYEGDIIKHGTEENYSWTFNKIPLVWQCEILETVILDETHIYHDEVYSAWKTNLAAHKKNYDAKFVTKYGETEAEANMLWLAILTTIYDGHITNIFDKIDTASRVNFYDYVNRRASGEYDITSAYDYLHITEGDLDGDGATNNQEFGNLYVRQYQSDDMILTKEAYLKAVLDPNLDGTS